MLMGLPPGTPELKVLDLLVSVAETGSLGQAAGRHDLIITSGGVSVGEEDHIRPAVQAEGRLNLWQIAIKPGKPLAFGEVDRGEEQGAAWFIGLPGNVPATTTELASIAAAANNEAARARSAAGTRRGNQVCRVGCRQPQATPSTAAQSRMTATPGATATSTAPAHPSEPPAVSSRTGSQRRDSRRRTSMLPSTPAA